MSLKFDQITNENFTFCPYMVASQGEFDFGLPKPKHGYPVNGIGFSCFDKHAEFIESHNFMKSLFEWELKGSDAQMQVGALVKAYMIANRHMPLAQTHQTEIMATIEKLCHIFSVEPDFTTPFKIH